MNLECVLWTWLVFFKTLPYPEFGLLESCNSCDRNAAGQNGAKRQFDEGGVYVPAAGTYRFGDVSRRDSFLSRPTRIFKMQAL